MFSFDALGFKCVLNIVINTTLRCVFVFKPLQTLRRRNRLVSILHSFLRIMSLFQINFQHAKLYLLFNVHMLVALLGVQFL